MHVTELRFGGDRVDLAHVAAAILLLDVVDVQKPGLVLVVLVVRDADARIARDDVIVHGQDGRLLKVDPGDLRMGIIMRRGGKSTVITEY